MGALYTLNGNSANDYFGCAVSGAGDVNGDGYDDVIVGAYRDNRGNGAYSGSARVFSGTNGAVLYTFTGDSANDYFGYAVSGAGDVNGDGYADLIVGAYGDQKKLELRFGSARVFSGRDGSVFETFIGDQTGDRFGWSVSGLGDVNGDGHDDLVVGAFADDNAGANSGSARVFVTQTGFVRDEVIYLSRDGKIGIGTHTPEEQLQVVGTVQATAFVGDGSGLTNLQMSAFIEPDFRTNEWNGAYAWGNHATNGYITTNASDARYVNVSGDSMVGGLTIASNLYVSGDAIVSGMVSFSSNLSVSGDYDILGNASVASNLSVSGDSTVIGDATVSGNVSVTSNLTVTGNALVSSDLNVSGDATVSSDLIVNGDASIASNLVVGTGTAVGQYAVAEGAGTLASGAYSYAQGNASKAYGTSSHAEGQSTVASNTASHAEGLNTLAGGSASHAAGSNAKATNNNTYVWSDGMLIGSTTSNQYTVYAAGGIRLLGGVISGNGAGLTNISEEEYVNVTGDSMRGSLVISNTLLVGSGTATGLYAVAEGDGTTANGNYSHAEGQATLADGQCSHAEGALTQAVADGSHAEGYNTTASGLYSHAEGNTTIASGQYSHAAGSNAKATNNNTYVWSDSTPFASTQDRQFNVNALNGIRLYGNAVYFNGSAVHTSDRRLKQNIVPLTGALGKVEQINGVYFEMIAKPDVTQVGVIAQDVEAVLPQVVVDNPEGYKSVDYSKLTALLIEAVKEQQAEIKGQQQQISELTERLETLEAK